MRVPLNITGGTNPARSVQLSAQVTRNFYPELQDDPFVKERYVLMPWPGKTLFSSGGTGADRGMFVHKGTLYKVSGITLYSIDNLGVHTDLGTIEGSTQCIFGAIEDLIVIANGSGRVYQYNQTETIELADSDLESPKWVAILKNAAIYGGDGGRFAVSKVGVPGTVNGLDYATAETSPDGLIRGYVFGDRAYMFGARTTEQWFFSGEGRPPMDYIEGGTVSIGLSSKMSVANNEESVYFLGSDRKVYKGGDSISTIALANVFEDFITVDDAKGFCFTLEGQNFYQLNFPTEDKTYVYSENSGQWFETSRASSTGRDSANSYAYVYGKHLVADYRDNNIYELDPEVYTENGGAIWRERTTGVIHGGMLGAPGANIELNQFELFMERGQGNLTVTDPKVMLQVSYNGGRTWGTEMWGSVGKSGEFQRKLVWSGLGSGEEIAFRIKTSDAAFFAIHSAAADINLGIV